MKLRVLFLSSWFPSKAHPTLGNFVQYHAEAISKFCDVTVLYLVKLAHEKNLLIEEEIVNNVQIIRVHYNKNGFLFSNRFKALKTGLTHLKNSQFNPNIIHFNVIWPDGWQALYASKKLKIPFCITDHWTGYHADERAPLNFFQKLYMRYVANRAASVLPVTYHMGQAMRRLGFKTDITVVPNVVNTSIFQPNSESPNEYQFLHISHLGDDHKNISGILRTWKKLTNHSNNIHLKIGGDGPIDHWKSVARSLEIPPSSISFFGTLTKVQVANQMMQSNCFVLFSNFENLPLVMIEAMCCGLTVITTNVGGCREFLPLDQGHFLIEKKDEDALFNAFVQAIEQKNIQIEKKKNISEYASKTFSNEAIGEQFNIIYHSILKLDAK
ncbi:MAG: hypothetical protein RL092_1765 [Bacteroidota bacterium]|jgi:glycosyltransferase involved in cell wall biosynthesis